MTDDELNELFTAVDKVKPSGPARQAAREAAIAAFARQSQHWREDSGTPANEFPAPQGNISPLRPTRDHRQNPGRRKIMTALNQRWLVSGLASAAVLVVTLAVLIKATNPAMDPSLEEGKRRIADLSNHEIEEVVVTASRVEERTAAADAGSAGVAQTNMPPVKAPVFAPFPVPQEASEMEMRKPNPRIEWGVHGFAISRDHNIAPPTHQDGGRDDFEHLAQSPVKRVADQPVSTFSVDVDTASYSFIRRQLNQGLLPQKDAVRVEEMLNYFGYDYPRPENREVPFKATLAVADAPWKPGNKLIHIGIRGYDIPRKQAPASNLVFLLDVSGSMDSPDKLPLVKASMALLLDQLKPTDTVAIVAYAGAAGTVLEPTPVKDKLKILAALKRLSAGGSTAGGQGIKLAYQLAQAGFDEKAVNRVILATDGDFNVGISNREELQGFVERQRESGIYLSVLGFGQGNYHDHLMQILAQNGNGMAAYIDTLGEAQKVLVDEATSTLFPIARDVKLQVEFNPATVSEYRLLGYETRALRREDFRNDRVDAGDIGAGHRVTAIYEITPAGAASGLYEASRYAGEAASRKSAQGDEYGFLKIRYKLPGEDDSKLITTAIKTDRQVEATGDSVLARETRFAAAVAGFAELLRGGKYAGSWTYDDAIKMASVNKGADPYGYRAEFVQLVRKASVAEAMR